MNHLLFRRIAFLENLSFLVLLFVAMPLKYAAGMPLAVRLTGSAHGALFVAYVVVLLSLALRERWRFTQVVWGLSAAVVPFGAILFERSVRPR